MRKNMRKEKTELAKRFHILSNEFFESRKMWEDLSLPTRNAFKMLAGYVLEKYTLKESKEK